VWRVGAPIVEIKNAVGGTFYTLFASFSHTYALVTENQRLRETLASTSVVLLDRNMLYIENLELKNRLERVPPQSIAILATVLNRPPATPYDTLLIDVGKQQGIMAGDFVAAGGLVYIGRVQEVYGTVSRVILFSAPGEVYSAILHIQAATSTLAISVSGQGGGSLTAEVPASTQVNIGDDIELPSIMPELIAKVVAVTDNSQASFKTIYAQLPVNIYTLKYVEVRRQPTVKYDQ
jgi:cell shape-determining protein MreC